MTYPKVSTTGDHTGESFGVPASPRLPEVEEGMDDHADNCAECKRRKAKLTEETS